MSTRTAFWTAFLFAKSILAVYVVLRVFDLADDQAETTLLWLFITTNIALGTMVARILQGSIVGKLPIKRALDGGVEQHLVEHPEVLPKSIIAAVQTKLEPGEGA